MFQLLNCRMLSLFTAGNQLSIFQIRLLRWVPIGHFKQAPGPNLHQTPTLCVRHVCVCAETVDFIYVFPIHTRTHMSVATELYVIACGDIFDRRCNHHSDVFCFVRTIVEHYIDINKYVSNGAVFITNARLDSSGYLGEGDLLTV